MILLWDEITVDCRTDTGSTVWPYVRLYITYYTSISFIHFHFEWLMKFIQSAINWMKPKIQYQKIRIVTQYQKIRIIERTHVNTINAQTSIYTVIVIQRLSELRHFSCTIIRSSSSNLISNARFSFNMLNLLFDLDTGCRVCCMAYVNVVISKWITYRLDLIEMNILHSFY